MGTTKRPSHPRAPDIELAASVSMDELRFVEPPETDVRFIGDPGHDSASGSDRTNLPEQVESGVTYRNVRVDYRLASRLAGPGSKRPDRERRTRRNEGRSGTSES